MLQRARVYLEPRTRPAPEESRQLEDLGYAVARDVLTATQVADLRGELESIYDTLPADLRNAQLSDAERDDFRYEMLNRSALAQDAVAHPRILEIIEPLLGENCHVIANTCWRNPAGRASDHGGGYWHIDAGPHIPRPVGVPWPEEIPYPIFAIGVHLYLIDCPAACGPTGVIPGSHKSGQSPPGASKDLALSWEGAMPVQLEARAGDVALFVSDIWHRRMPTGEGDAGRFFLQIHYGRRDIAQRLRPTSEVNQLSEEAVARAVTDRQRTVIGLHPPLFYDG